jgi:hypothetical protein
VTVCLNGKWASVRRMNSGVQDRDKQRDFVNTVIDIRLPLMIGNLIVCTSISS